MRAPALLAAVLLVLGASGCGNRDAAEETSGAATSASPSPTESDLGPAAGADPDASEVPSPGAPSAPADLPECAEVWSAGQTLPARYAGCTDDGTSAADEIRPCESGQQIATYDDTFWAVPGGPVNEADSLETDQGYLDAVLTCTG